MIGHLNCDNSYEINQQMRKNSAFDERFTTKT